MSADADAFPWWSALRHGGLLIAPARLQEHFGAAAAALPPLRYHDSERLRRELTKFAAAPAAGALGPFADVVLEEICGLDHAGGVWTKGSAVDSARFSRRSVTGEAVRPARVYETTNHGVLPVFFTKEKRLGVGLGRREAARVVEWLRAVDLPFALATNGRQWRLCYAGLDIDAWCEWESEQWFAQGAPGPQIDALRLLLSPTALRPSKPDQPSPLLQAVRDTRSGQAELSKELGENVRRAVEILIRAYGPTLVELTKTTDARDVYLAATRTVMRMVVALFAEARDLLPRGDVAYHASYGLQGLREDLDRTHASGRGERLRHRVSAWPRVAALFRLIHEGSHHEDLSIRRYGGSLFEAGDAAASEGVARALAVFENATGEHLPDDLAVWGMLDLLCRSRVKVRQGRGATWTTVAVDFADLSTEYIGILYEGLLDYELRRAPEGDPIVFLNVGDEPALPLSRLRKIPDDDLPDLFKRLGKKSTMKVAAEEEEDGDKEEDEEDEESDDYPDDADGGDEAVSAASAEEPTVEFDVDTAHRRSVQEWAEHGVVAAKLVPKPKGRRTPAVEAEYRRAVGVAAQSLIGRVVAPGEWFLVRWGGTRKGAGTFYTPPSLAVPTVHRTLRPLAYDPPDDASRRDEAIAWTPKTPEQILALKVCDPAMGSASFLIAALRFITDALVAALHRHDRLKAQGEGVVATLAEGKPGSGALVEETIPARIDAAEFDDLLRARLKRYVVEHCIYGVDLDPLAVELARLALWIETMDRSLPFDFLEHKLRPGNSLVGCWFDRYRDYPLLAWKREGGDKDFESDHRAKSAWTKAIKEQFDRVRPALAARLLGNRQGGLFDDSESSRAAEAHAASAAAFHALHDLPVHEPDRKAENYRSKIANNPERLAQLQAFDLWCALWFWPAADLHATPAPDALTSPPSDAVDVLRRMKSDRALRFFHWELEFPDVFAGPDAGFDAVIGNPPWEIQKPNSKEWFSEHDPLYRGYGKQDALARQKEWFAADGRFEERWLAYKAFYKAFSNWTKNVGSPFGDGEADGETAPLGKKKSADSDELHRAWRKQRGERRRLSDPEHPFRHQGSADLNTYKMFVELAHAITRKGGRFAFITPSGLYTDKGTTDLRKLLLDRCRLEWLFSFENRRKLFEIDSRFKFGPFIAEKGGATEAIRTAFMRHDPTDWADAERFATPYARAQVERFSPFSSVVLEISSPRDLSLLDKLYSAHQLLASDFRGALSKTPKLRYLHHEFFATADSRKFRPRDVWTAQGYEDSGLGFWTSPRGERAWPITEGRMIDHFDFAAKRHVSGRGRGAVWHEEPWSAKTIVPQFLVSEEECRLQRECWPGWKLTLMDVVSATNARTVYGVPTTRVVTVDSCRNLIVDGGDGAATLALSAIMCSLIYDWQVRYRVGGLHLTVFQMEETVLPRLSPRQTAQLSAIAFRLACSHAKYADAWLIHRPSTSAIAGVSWRQLWAVTTYERLRLRCIVDGVVAALFGVNEVELRWILQDCDHPAEKLASKQFARTLDPKGFWRIDKDQPPELRHTILTLVAFRDLKRRMAELCGDESAAIADFCAEPDDLKTGAPSGRGWLLPETLCLADYGLGRDDRAKSHQPVRTVLGPRFYDWQLAQSPEESWAECRRHAEALSATFPPPPAVDASAADGSSIAADAPRAGSPPSPAPPKSIQRGLWD